jgi:hypothetical protein
VSSRQPLQRNALELARLLLESVVKLHSTGDHERARQAYEKALTVCRSAESAGSDRAFQRRLKEVGALLGVQAKPLRKQGRQPLVRKARA